jgi:hypothetical protein
MLGVNLEAHVQGLGRGSVLGSGMRQGSKVGFPGSGSIYGLNLNQGEGQGISISEPGNKAGPIAV